MSEISIDLQGPKAVVLTAIPFEYLAVRRHVINTVEIVHPKGNIYERGIFKGSYHNWHIGLANINVDSHTCALQTERVISYFNPDAVIFVGIAGGIKNIKLGDVVIAKRAFGITNGSLQKVVRRPTVGLSSPEIFERARLEATKEDWKQRLPKEYQKRKLKALTKDIAAGEGHIIDSVELNGVVNKFYKDIVAVEIGSSEFYAVCHAREDLQFLIVKGISDLLVKSSKANSLEYREIAARNASAFAFEVLSRFKIK